MKAVRQTRTKSMILEDNLIFLKDIFKQTVEENPHQEPVVLNLSDIIKRINVSLDLGALARLEDLNYITVTKLSDGKKAYLWTGDTDHRPDMSDAIALYDRINNYKKDSREKSKAKKQAASSNDENNLSVTPKAAAVKKSKEPHIPKADDKLNQIAREQGMGVAPHATKTTQPIKDSEDLPVLRGVHFTLEHFSFLHKMSVDADVIINDDLIFHDVDFVLFLDIDDYNFGIQIFNISTLHGDTKIGTVLINKATFRLGMKRIEDEQKQKNLHIYTK